MGVDYRANSGYGFAIPEEDIERLAIELDYEEAEWGFDPYDFGSWLVEDFSALTFEHVGNFMAGTDMFLVIEAASVAQQLDFYGWNSGMRQFSTSEVSINDKTSLHMAYKKVFGVDPKPGDIGWYMAATVS